MLAADVLAMDCGQGPHKLAQTTPQKEDCPARLIKRKRACVNYASQAGSPDQQQSVGQGASAAAPAPVAASVPWAASFLLDYVRQCLNNLTSMHATCIAIQRDTRAAELACAIFRRTFLSRDPKAQADLVRERLLAGALLAASLWLAIKFEATRTTTPDANLMSRISGIPAGMLRQQERQILADLSWDLMTPAREAGAVALPDMTDRVCREQQEQLAALAAPPLAPALLLQPAAGVGTAWRAANLLMPGRQIPTQQVVCNNLLAQPEEHEECFPASAAGGVCKTDGGWGGSVPTAALAALGW